MNLGFMGHLYWRGKEEILHGDLKFGQDHLACALLSPLYVPSDEHELWCDVEDYVLEEEGLGTPWLLSTVTAKREPGRLSLYTDNPHFGFGKETKEVVGDEYKPIKLILFRHQPYPQILVAYWEIATTIRAGRAQDWVEIQWPEEGFLVISDPVIYPDTEP